MCCPVGIVAQAVQPAIHNERQMAADTCCGNVTNKIRYNERIVSL